MSKVMIVNVASILLALLLAVPVAAESLRDPMQPPDMTRSVNKPSGKSAWSLTSTLISGGRRVAMINGVLVGVGDKVSGARVMSISGNSVSLTLDGKPFRISLAIRTLRKSSMRVNR